MTEPHDTTTPMDRKHFLQTLVGAGAAIGLGAMATGTAHADDPPKSGKYVFIVAHGSEDPNRPILALVLAKAAAKKASEVHVWLTLGGGELANKTKAAAIRSPSGFTDRGTALEMMTELVGLGVKFWVCPPCGKTAGATGDDRHPDVKDAGGPWIVDAMVGATVSCY